MSKRARNVVEPPVFELQRGVLPVVVPVILPEPEAGLSNVKQHSNEVLPCGNSSRYNRYGKIDVTRLTETELEELQASESDGGIDCNDDIEDIDWVPNGAASDEELEDVLELHESDDDDEMNYGENGDADMIHQVEEEPDWNATISLLGPDMTYTSKDGTALVKNPLPITRTRLHNITRENGAPTNRNMQTRCDTMGLFLIMS